MVGMELADTLGGVAAMGDVRAVVIGAGELTNGVRGARLTYPSVLTYDEIWGLVATERAGHRDRPISSWARS